jgi:hypothetical protein
LPDARRAARRARTVPFRRAHAFHAAIDVRRRSMLARAPRRRCRAAMLTRILRFLPAFSFDTHIDFFRFSASIIATPPTYCRLRRYAAMPPRRQLSFRHTPFALFSLASFRLRCIFADIVICHYAFVMAIITHDFDIRFLLSAISFRHCHYCRHIFAIAITLI